MVGVTDGVLVGGGGGGLQGAVSVVGFEQGCQ